MQKILIIGANGFLGSHITRELSQSLYVSLSCLIRPTSDKTSLLPLKNKINILEGDVTDYLSLKRAFEGIDIIVHTAAVVSYHSGDSSLMQKINVEGTANVVNVALECRVKKIIFLSSTAALGRRKIKETIDEKVKWIRSPLNTEYAISKYKSEQEVWRGQAEGLDIAILNPSLVLGIGDFSKSSLKIINQIAGGLPFYPTGQVGIVDVKDVAIAVRKVIEQNISGYRIILCAENWSYKDFFTYITNKLGVSPPRYALKPFIASFILAFEKLRSIITGKKQAISGDSIKTSSVSPNYRNELSKSLLKLEYRPLKDTIDEMIAHYNKINRPS